MAPLSAHSPRQTTTLALKFLHVTRIQPLTGRRVPSNDLRCRPHPALLPWSRSQIVHEVQLSPLVLRRYSPNLLLHRALMSLTAAATSIVDQSAEEKSTLSVKPSDLSKAKVLPGRRPRISRSKVIARLASQRAAGAGPSVNAGTQHSGGKMRSNVSAEVAGKTRQSYAGTRGGDMMMSAKKRFRQSEQAQWLIVMDKGWRWIRLIFLSCRLAVPRHFISSKYVWSSNVFTSSFLGRRLPLQWSPTDC